MIVTVLLLAANLSIGKMLDYFYDAYRIELIFPSLWNLLASAQYCVFDFNVYYNEGSYSSRDFANWWSWNCQDSYIVVMDQTKVGHLQQLNNRKREISIRFFRYRI